MGLGLAKKGVWYIAPSRRMAVFFILVIQILTLGGLPTPAIAESMLEALRRTHDINPALRAVRQGVSATSENLPIARSGYLPSVDSGAQAGYHYDSAAAGVRGGLPYNIFLEVKQPVFDGFKTKNSIRQAKAQMSAAHEDLRNLEQATLFDAARVYMDVQANTTILKLHDRHLNALGKQLALVQSRREFGDAIGSDVAEVEARLAAAQSQRSRAKAALNTVAAEYSQITGGRAARTSAVNPPDALISDDLRGTIARALKHHPAIIASAHTVNAAQHGVGIIESERLPTFDIVGKATIDGDGNVMGSSQYGASVMAELSIPLFRGGAVQARERQAIHIAAQRQMENNSIRDQVVAAIMSSWGQLEDAKVRLRAATTEVKAAKVRLEGYRQSYEIGERTISDVLNVERDLLTAQIGLAVAQRDRVVAIFAVALASGNLEISALDDALNRRSTGPGEEIEMAISTFTPRTEKRKKKTKRSVELANCKNCKSSVNALLRSTLTDVGELSIRGTFR